MESPYVRYAVLGSGSKANCYIIENNSFAIIIDQGYSLKELNERLYLSGFNSKKIRYIFLTHDHSDHSKGVADLARTLNIPVIMHQQATIKNSDSFQRWDIRPGRYYEDQSLNFESFLTSHDAPHSLGYSIELSGFRFTFITDTGKILDPMRDYAECSNILFLESNYSSDMLVNGPYPDYLKRRVGGNKGHLSNDASAQFLSSLSGSCLKTVYLCHLSESNNTPDCVAKEVGSNYFFDTIICPRNELMPAVKLDHSISEEYLPFVG